MVYGDKKHLKAIKERQELDRLKRRSPVKVEVIGWVDQGGNREVFDKVRDKVFKSSSKAEDFIMKKFGSGSRPFMKIKSIIDGKEIW